MHCVDLGERFPTSIYTLAKFGFDKAENELSKVCRSKQAIPTPGHKFGSGRSSAGLNPPPWSWSTCQTLYTLRHVSKKIQFRRSLSIVPIFPVDSQGGGASICRAYLPTRSALPTLLHPPLSHPSLIRRWKKCLVLSTSRAKHSKKRSADFPCGVLSRALEPGPVSLRLIYAEGSTKNTAFFNSSRLLEMPGSSRTLPFNTGNIVVNEEVGISRKLDGCSRGDWKERHRGGLSPETGQAATRTKPICSSSPRLANSFVLKLFLDYRGGVNNAQHAIQVEFN